MRGDTLHNMIHKNRTLYDYQSTMSILNQVAQVRSLMASHTHTHTHTHTHIHTHIHTHTYTHTSMALCVACNVQDIWFTRYLVSLLQGMEYLHAKSIAHPLLTSKSIGIYRGRACITMWAPYNNSRCVCVCGASVCTGL